MVDFTERIKNLEEYNPEFIFKEGAFRLSVQFKKNWKPILPEDKDVVGYKYDETINRHLYASMIEDIEKIFDLIDETVSVNKEMEKKVSLYKEKVKELQELFLSDIPYEKLAYLKFVFEEQKKGNKKKKKATLTEEDTEDTQIIGEVKEESDIDKKINEVLKEDNQ